MQLNAVIANELHTSYRSDSLSLSNLSLSTRARGIDVQFIRTEFGLSKDAAPIAVSSLFVADGE